MRNHLFIGFLVLGLGGIALAQRGQPTANRVNLPWQISDQNGNQWSFYQHGVLRQQGNMPFYSQAAVLVVNGNGLSGNANSATLDPKTGELLIEGLNSRNGITISRRIQASRVESYVRYIDSFRNSTAQDQTLAIQYTSNFNYTPNSVQFVEDPRGKEKMLGSAISLDIGRSLFEIYAGKGSKVTPQFLSQPNSNQVQATIQLVVPANKQASIVHVHGVVSGPEMPSQTILGMKDSKLLADVPVELRKTIANASAIASVGDREVLRGDLLDVIELRDGDQLKGTLNEPSYKLQAFYGAIELPADRVVGVINVGQFRPRQLLVTADGEVFGGSLGKEAIGIQLSSGQTVQVPLGQISRIGYRKRVGEPEEWTFEKPWVSLRSGERLFIDLPAQPIDVMTRFGLLKLPPAAVAGLLLESEEHGVHEIRMKDGSHFAGLVALEQFNLQLSGTAIQQKVTIPSSMIQQIRLSAKEPEVDDSAAVLTLTNGDELVGLLEGRLQLDTRFDTISMEGSEIRSITRDPEAGLDIQAILWDQTTIGGQLRDATLKHNLSSGLSILAPLGLVQSYRNPLPKPSEAMIVRIKKIVEQLSADDWKQREQAEAQLVALGPSILSVLKELTGKVPPEAQQRIDSIMIQLHAQQEPAIPTPTPSGPATPVRIR